MTQATAQADPLQPDTARCITSVRPRPSATASLWLRLVLPSLADLLFISIICATALGTQRTWLLTDADTGWHIRNGEHILQTLSIPHTDYFSYTMPGQPWFAWEWLFDVMVGFIHRHAGLNGVVLFAAAIIAATFALLLRFLLSRGTNLAVAALMAPFCVMSSMVHSLARPHVLTWFFVVIWLDMFRRYEQGARRSLYWLPALMVVWVNIHGGFLLGIALTGIFLANELWSYAIATGPKDRLRTATSCKVAGSVFGLCVLATFLNPYGYKLHLHVYRYLSNSFFMNTIQEFQPPNFRHPSALAFEFLLLFTLCILAIRKSRPRVVEVLLILFAVYLGLLAGRNLPIATIVLAWAAAPLANIAEYARGEKCPSLVRRICTSLEAWSEKMVDVDRLLKGHAVPIALLLFLAVIALRGGSVGSQRLMFARFPDDRLPIAATEVVIANDIEDGLFSPDSWGGYLIYRVPRLKVFLDDRHDFYGEAFLKDALKASLAEDGWEDLFDRYRVRWVLWPREAAIVNMLRRDPRWKTIYEDQVAVLLAKMQ